MKGCHADEDRNALKLQNSDVQKDIFDITKWEMII